MLFCLVVDSLTKSLSSILNLFYLNDGTDGGPPDHVMDDLATAMESADELGFELQMRQMRTVCDRWVRANSSSDCCKIPDGVARHLHLESGESRVPRCPING